MAISIPFALAGDTFADRFSAAGTVAWLEEAGREHGWWMGLLLLAGDLVLPVPATGVMSGLGYVYGIAAGGAIAAAGSFAAGMTGYGLCRAFGEKGADRLMGAKDRERGERLFAGPAGGWLVVLSRCLPLLPEVVACMAGLVRMPAGRFMVSLAAGSAATAFLFAAIGASGMDRPGLAVVLSVLVPAVLYGISLAVIRRAGRR